MTTKHNFVVLGLMSGTSLDGVDLALCHFTGDNNEWTYSIEAARTIPYSNEWKNRLIAAETFPGIDLLLLHKTYGAFLGELAHTFLKERKAVPHFIASHGHTIFHQPEKKLTFQLGDGASIAATTRITTISDFRSLDVALGGQGAPLVPIGDELLFHEYNQCLNLGGFANISFSEKGSRKAYDICSVNLILNYLAAKYCNTPYDKNGSIGRSGKVNHALLDQLNKLGYFEQKPPKSLSREWVVKNMLPLIESQELTIPDKLRTVYENIAVQLTKVINATPGNNILVTGGGAYNIFLVELIKEKTRMNIIVPDKMVIDFKEALIFAFLGVLRFLDIPNCLASVTGAKKDNLGGVIFNVSTFQP